MTEWEGYCWREVPFLSIDTETTGLSSQDRICEIALVLYRNGEELRSFSTRLNPGVPIDESASLVHGITAEDVADAPRFDDVADEIMEFLGLGVPWVMHNAPFDMRMLIYDLGPDRVPTHIPTLCTLSYAKHIHPETKKNRRHRLVDLAAYYHIDFDYGSVHSALYDARVLCWLVERMMADVPVLSSYTKLSHEWIR